MLKKKLLTLSLLASFKVFANDEVYVESIAQPFLNSYSNQQCKREKPLYKPLNPAKAKKLRAPGTKVYAAAENAYLIENTFRDKNHPGYIYARSQRAKADNIYREVDMAYQAYLIADDLYRKTVPKEYHVAAHRAFLVSDEMHERFLQTHNSEFAKLRREALKLRSEYYSKESEAVETDDLADDAFNSIEE